MACQPSHRAGQGAVASTGVRSVARVWVTGAEQSRTSGAQRPPRRSTVGGAEYRRDIYAMKSLMLRC